MLQRVRCRDSLDLIEITHTAHMLHRHEDAHLLEGGGGGGGLFQQEIKVANAPLSAAGDMKKVVFARS